MPGMHDQFRDIRFMAVPFVRMQAYGCADLWMRLGNAEYRGEIFHVDTDAQEMTDILCRCGGQYGVNAAAEWRQIKPVEMTMGINQHVIAPLNPGLQ
jgi:hypothetical protein